MTTIEFRAPWSKSSARDATVLSLVILALPMLAAIFAPMQSAAAALRVLLIGVPPLLVAAAFAG